MKLVLIFQIYSLSLYEEMTVKILIQGGTKLHLLQVKYPGKCPGEFVQDANTRVCSASDRAGNV